jgi:acyl-CoA synthetase (AMP-forming)/AMP-acid ligase II
MVESGGVRGQLGQARVIARSGLLGPLRPDKYLKMAGAIRRHGLTAMTGASLAAARRPFGIALVDERGALTWGELEERTDALATGLSAHITKQGVDGSAGRVGLLARNHRGFVESLVATGKLGADLVLLNTAFSGPQLAELLGREQVDVLIYDQEYAAALVDLPGVDDGGPVHVTAWEDEPATGLTVDGLISEHLGHRPPAPTGSPHVVLLTSGTTGAPKGAKRGTGGGAGDLVAIIERVPWRAEDTVVVAAPMFHAWGFGCLVLAATMANTVVMRRHFDPEETLAMAARHRADGMAVVPVMLERIVGLPTIVKSRYPLPALRFVTASGSAMEPTALTEFMDTFGDVVYSNYNATEAGMIATATPEDLRVDPRSAGRPVRGCRLRILGEDGAELPTGEVGQIAVLNTTPFEGYTQGDTKDQLDGYMLTGDLGRLDAEGRLNVEGRVDDMIISGGENVYPAEVEAVLGQHSDVIEAAVVGVADEAFGQRLLGYVVLKPGAKTNAQDLRTHVRDQLANYKVPRDIVVLDELPRNASGKVVKKQLPRP